MFSDRLALWLSNVPLLLSALQATQRSGSQKSRDSAEVKFNVLLKTLHKAESHICNNIKCSFYLYSARVLKRTCFVGVHM